MAQIHPLRPSTEETAKQNIQMAKDDWNFKDPAKVGMAYSPDSEWRNRIQFIKGREEMVAFLTQILKDELNKKHSIT